ncbi:FNIp repeat-containing protein [Saudi moumouvirus]|nr:FNIp repeat-containing protein [Saudi moumouvirus]
MIIYNHNKIKDLPYYSRFKYINYKANNKHIPNGVTLSSPVFDKLGLRVFKNSAQRQVRDKVIPSRLTHLIFGNDFNQSIKGCIPNSVTLSSRVFKNTTAAD